MVKRIEELKELVEILTIAIGREQASIEYYKTAYEKSPTDTSRRMFSILLEQEKGHEARLQAQLHEIKAEIEIEEMK